MYCENDVSALLEEDLTDMEVGILGRVQDGGGSHSQEEKEQPSG